MSAVQRSYPSLTLCLHCSFPHLQETSCFLSYLLCHYLPNTTSVCLYIHLYFCQPFYLNDPPSLSLASDLLLSDLQLEDSNHPWPIFQPPNVTSNKDSCTCNKTQNDLLNSLGRTPPRNSDHSNSADLSEKRGFTNTVHWMALETRSKFTAVSNF